MIHIHPYKTHSVRIACLEEDGLVLNGAFADGFSAEAALILTVYKRTVCLRDHFIVSDGLPLSSIPESRSH